MTTNNKRFGGTFFIITLSDGTHTQSTSGVLTKRGTPEEVYKAVRANSISGSEGTITEKAVTHFYYTETIWMDAEESQ